MNKTTKIGYDYHGVLDVQYWMQVKAYADAHRSNTEVYIITKGSKKIDGKAIYKLAYMLDIPDENIYFTDGEPKSPIINELGIEWYYDDKPENKEEIEANSNCKVYIV